MDVNLRVLRHAIALAQHRHYGRAAAALNISQPALSRSIAAFERSLGVPLFARGAGGIRPTEFGQILVARGTVLLNGAAELTRELTQLQGLETGELRVGAGLYPAAISVGQALGRLTVGRPGLRVSLIAESWQVVTAAVRAGSLDVAIVELSTLENDLRVTTEPLEPHPAAFVCRAGHPLLGDPAPSVTSILAFPLVGPTMPPRISGLLSRIAPNHRLDDAGNFIPPYHVESVQTVKAILQSGNTVAVLPLLLMEAELEAGTLHVIPCDAPWLHTQYGFAWPADHSPARAARALIRSIRAVEAEQIRRSATLARRWLSLPSPA